MSRPVWRRLAVRLPLAAALMLTLTAQSCHLFSGSVFQDLRAPFRQPASAAPPAVAAVPPPPPCADGSAPFVVADGSASACPPAAGAADCAPGGLAVEFPEAAMAMCIPPDIVPAASCGAAMPVTDAAGRTFCFAAGPVANTCPNGTRIVFGAEGEKVVACLVACTGGEVWDAAAGCRAA